MHRLRYLHRIGFFVYLLYAVVLLSCSFITHYYDILNKCNIHNARKPRVCIPLIGETGIGGKLDSVRLGQ